MIPAALDYGGQRVRGSDLFDADTPIAMTKKFLKGLKVSCNFNADLLEVHTEFELI